MNYITMNDGNKIPQLGFGVFQIPAEETAEAVYEAIKAGYRLIDTAIVYGNEVEVGIGIKKAIDEGLVTRDELFITTKLFVDSVVSEEVASKDIRASLNRLNLEYVDLFLIHQPYGDVYAAWRALGKAKEEGLIKSIGVSNFSAGKIVEFSQFNSITPAINQIEINPWHQRDVDLEWNKKYGVVLQAWAPFAEGRHDLFTNEVLKEIGKKYSKSVGQVVLRWLIQRNVVVLAKSVRPERMAENIDVFDFELTAEDMETIAGLNRNESAFFYHYDPERVEFMMNYTKNILENK